MKVRLHLLLALWISIGLDGLTKFWAERALALHDSASFVGEFVRLTLSYNTGVAFGLLAGRGVWPLVISGLIVIGLGIWLVATLRNGRLSHTATWSIGLILGGAIANFSDHLPDGRVTDFLDPGLARFVGPPSISRTVSLWWGLVYGC